MNLEERLMRETLKGLEAQGTLADTIVGILIDDSDYVTKNPILSLAVFQYISNRTALASVAERVKDAGLMEGVDEMIEELGLDDENDDS